MHFSYQNERKHPRHVFSTCDSLPTESVTEQSRSWNSPTEPDIGGCLSAHGETLGTTTHKQTIERTPPSGNHIRISAHQKYTKLRDPGRTGRTLLFGRHGPLLWWEGGISIVWPPD